MEITNRHLAFLERAKEAFSEDVRMESYRDADGSLLALRRGLDRDCVEILEIRYVAFFSQMISESKRPNESAYGR